MYYSTALFDKAAVEMNMGIYCANHAWTQSLN